MQNIPNWSQQNFAHVMTVTLPWRVQNFVVIGKVHFKPEHCKIWSNFKFDRNIVSGTVAWSESSMMKDISCPMSLIARFMGPTWGPPGADRTQVGPMWATWTLLSGMFLCWEMIKTSIYSLKSPEINYCFPQGRILGTCTIFFRKDRKCKCV